MINKLTIQKFSIILTLFTISSCSTYPNKFKCGDAKGLGCTMLRDVDKQIDSGQIEEAYKSKSTRCSGKNCSFKTTDEMLNLKNKDVADSYKDERQEQLEDENGLYF